MDPKRNDPPKKPDGDDKKPKNIWMTVFISVAILLAVISIFNLVNNSQYTETTYSDFVDAMNANNLEEVEIKYDRIIYMTKEEAAKPANEQQASYTGLPNGDRMKLLDDLHITQSTLSHHMKLLCDAGVVQGRKEGKWVHYSIDPAGAEAAVELLRQQLSLDISCNTGGQCCGNTET